jgi:flavin-dependent dehydrogenase
VAGPTDSYDVVVVGASTAGCTAARLFALEGLRVALIERRPAIDAYKTVCTHFIQSSAAPTIEKLGLARLIDARGAVHNKVDIWTRPAGWIRMGDVEAPHGYNVTRRTLDPILRTLAAETPGVELLAGWTATGLVGNGRPTGVEVQDRGRTTRRRASGPTDGSSTGPTGAGCARRARARGCGCSSPTPPTPSPTRTTSP